MYKTITVKKKIIICDFCKGDYWRSAPTEYKHYKHIHETCIDKAEKQEK